MVGTTISHYKVIEKIGQGGMGEVYRAEDTNLSRDVAIKVLPEQFTKDPQRLARFEREAKLLASLNHPNIAAIYGFEEADDVRFLAMELVPGETLAERVAKGPVPVEETLEICRQIAEGVEAAHEKGVIHRDLKPANVKVTPEGKVKILDFGLAKAFEDEIPAADISQSPTLTEEMTRAGVILGTAAYMSPEQAKGKPVDKRADIFAFGAVLYELLTGKRAFEGETITETLAKILEGEPDWELLPENTPWTIRTLLHRCLTKDPHDRLDGIANVRVEIKLALSEPSTVSQIGLDGAIQPPLWRRAIPWSIAVVAVVVTCFALWSLTRTNSSPLPTSRLSITLPPDTILNLRGFPGSALALSPDGSELVFVGSPAIRETMVTDLYVRSLHDFEVHHLPVSGRAHQPFFSPDGKWVGFFGNDNRLKKVSLGGGEAVTVLDEIPDSQWAFGSWGDDDTLVFDSYDRSGIWRISANGGTPEELTTPDLAAGEIAHSVPQFLPGALAVVFGVRRNAPLEPSIDVVILETGERRTLIDNARRPFYAASGHLLFVRDQIFMAVPFDSERIEISGSEGPVAERVRLDSTGVPQITVSRNGTLAYVRPVVETHRALMWVDEQADYEVLAAPSRRYQHLRLSPDGQLVAVATEPPDQRHIHLYDLGRNVLTQFTQQGSNRNPMWTPDGSRLVFFSSRDEGRGLYWKAVDGSTPAELLVQSEQASDLLHPGSWSPDGKFLAYTVQGSTGADIWVLSLEEERRAEPFLAMPTDEYTPMFSPDGRWLAYVSQESGQSEVYLQRYPGGGNKVQISGGGGLTPVWARGGQSLFYQTVQGVMVLSITTEPELQIGSPTLLFNRGNPVASLDGQRAAVPYARRASNWGAMYDVAPQGDRLLMVYQEEDPGTATEVQVVQNWFEELKRLVPTN